MTALYRQFTHRWRDAWPCLPAILGPAVLLAPFLAGRQVLYWGTPLLQFYPWRQVAVEAVRASEWPLWNPYVGLGAPLLANYQSALLYPPNWLGLVLPLDVSMGWLAALHLAWAGLGMVVLARALTVSALGQAVAGLAFGLSQYLVARAGFLSINAAVAWLPWIVWAVQRAAARAGAPLREQARAWLALAALVALQLLAGHAQTAAYTLLLAAAWAGFQLRIGKEELRAGASELRRDTARRAVTAVGLLGGVALGFGTAAAQLLPTAELMQASPRAEAADYNFVVTYSYSPWRLLTLVAPDLLGNPARAGYFGYGNYWEDAAYAGVLPLLLAVGAVAGTVWDWIRGRGTGRDQGLIAFLLAVAVTSVVLALGRNTPVFPFFYRHVPTFDLFQAPARMLLWLAFALALLAGLGVDRWRAPEGWGLYWARLGTMGAVGTVLIGLAILLAVRPGALWALPGGLAIDNPEALARASLVARAFILLGVGLSIAGVLALLKGHVPQRAWQGAVVAFVVLDLLYAGAGLNPGAPHDLFRQPAATSAELQSALGSHRLAYFPDDEYRVKFGRFLSFREFGAPALATETRAAQLPNTAGLDGLASANNFDPLLSARYAGLMEVISVTRSLALLRMIDVAVIASSMALDLERVPAAAAGEVRFYRVPDSATGPQRAWVVGQAEVVPDAAAARDAIADPDFDPTTTVVLEGDAHLNPGPSTAHTPISATLALTGTFNTVRIAVVLPQPGWLVLADSAYPGWSAMVDGRPAALLNANYALRAVAVGAGEHRIVLTYWPRSLQIGLLVTAMSSLAWLVVAAWARLGAGGRCRACGA